MIKLLKTISLGIWIVPDSQIYILNLPYQEHVFRLFHERLANRLGHYVGIPMAIATLYAALPSGLGLAVGGIITAIHLALAVRYRLWLLCAVAPVVQAALGLIGIYVLAPLYSAHFNVLSSPWFHIFGWSLLQYATHALETKLPEPWAPKNMMPRSEWLRHAGVRHALLALLAVIPHVFVEWISGPRNLFLLLIRLARRLGYCSPSLKKIDNDLRRIQASGEPVLRYAHFHQEINRAS